MSAAMQEEAQKKNTDCVYFLASPLTCKKGNECEFRHSESARNNPRDCWYWLSGACLNSNCAFRHPPLEALPEGEPAVGGKLRVPCYYFLQGYCVKGDKCSFLHGLPAASATETSQKTLKSNIAKTGDVLDNQTSANKGSGSTTSKTSFEYYETPAGVHPQKLNQAQDVDANIANRIPEGSDSSAPVRSRPLQDSEKSKQVSTFNGRLHQVHTSENDFLHQEAQTEDDPLCDFHPGDDGLGQDPSGEDQIHNGTESEELWEESSFDVLVDDGVTDQLIYADDLDYLKQYDAIVDHLTGIRGADGFVDFDYDHTGAYGQYYDAEYELATYDAYEQQLVYEHLSSFDPEDGGQSVVALDNRQPNNTHLRDRREVPFVGDIRPTNVASNDLRNHIVKRRRAEKNQEDYHRRRHQGSNGSQHNRRHQDGHSKQQDRLARRHMSPQTGSRSNWQYQIRGESSGGRQFHGRLGEPLGSKRTYRDTSSGHEETSVERGPGKKFRGINDNFKAKDRLERGRSTGFGTDDALGMRGHQHSKNAEIYKDDSSFAGPKSLAQIKAEKLKVIEERGSSQQQESQGELNGGAKEVAKRQVSQMRSKIFQGNTMERPLKELDKASKPAVRKESDFEGPKPLSVILQQKRREDANGEAREQRHEKNFQQDDDIAVPIVATGESKPSSSVLAAARDSSSNEPYLSANLSSVQGNSRMGMRVAESNEHGLRRHGEFLANIRDDLADKDSNRLDKEVDLALDAEDGVGVADSAIEDVDFEDDDEDDFAKKLGGFFS